MNPPRFQFTMMGLLWATFWVAVSAAAWSLCFSLWRDHKALVLIVALIGVATPFVAFGAIFGKPLKGLAVFGELLLLGPEAWLLIGVLIFVAMSSVAGWVRGWFG